MHRVLVDAGLVDGDPSPPVQLALGHGDLEGAGSIIVAILDQRLGGHEQRERGRVVAESKVQAGRSHHELNPPAPVAAVARRGDRPFDDVERVTPRLHALEDVGLDLVEGAVGRTLVADPGGSRGRPR